MNILYVYFKNIKKHNVSRIRINKGKEKGTKESSVRDYEKIFFKYGKNILLFMFQNGTV